MSPDNLAILIRSFFEEHLVTQRGLSGHTVLAYRDSMKLFLQYACERLRKTCPRLVLEDLKPELLRAFLTHLEKARNSSAATRNARLAAIHSFFQYLATVDPRYIAQCQSILTVPFKRREHRVPVFLDQNEIRAIFSCIDPKSLLGQRDDALLRLLYNTGMRAQELVDLDIQHLRLTRPHHVLMRGKGRRERTCPLWKETVDSIKAYLARRENINTTSPLFVGTDNNRLTRFGIRYIVSHRVANATKVCPSLLTKKISPHSIRHTTALHLLQSNVDLSMIRSWLGHASIETTNSYVEIDLEMKRKTLKASEHLMPKTKKKGPTWRQQTDLITWLSNL